jgi:hypothetical protein
MAKSVCQCSCSGILAVVAMRKLSLARGEEVVQRARQQDLAQASKSDEQVVEDALAVFLGLRALERAYRSLQVA